MRSWGNAPVPSPLAPARPELFSAVEEDSVSCLIPALRRETAPGKEILELPTSGAVRWARRPWAHSHRRERPLPPGPRSSHPLLFQDNDNTG